MVWLREQRDGAVLSGRGYFQISTPSLSFLAKTSLNEVFTFQGRIRIIKQKEQRYERNKRQEHRTAL